MAKSKSGILVLKILIILLLAVILALLILPKHVGRYFYWNYADLNDHKKFENLEIKKGENTYHFENPQQNHQFELPSNFNNNEELQTFDNFLEQKETVAFLVVKNDNLVYENYFDDYDSSSIIPSFSTSKAFVSALVGIAIDEGYIYSTGQSITFFLKELGPEFDPITIEDLLNMRSGIDFSEVYNSPFADMAKYYYGTDLLKYIKQLEVKEPPDRSYDYISVNTILLGLIIERATNTKLNTYLENKIWRPLGMESDASWSIDSKRNKTFKANCCLNAVARDFARFGKLYLDNGKCGEDQIIPEAWVERSTTIINDSKDSQGYPYTYQWRVLENGSYFAKGIMGQYIYVYPDEDLVFVRLGKKYGGIDWVEVFLELSEQIP